MDKLIKILWENPLLLILAVGWIIGAVSNASKAKGASESRGERRQARRRARREKLAGDVVQRPIRDRRQAPTPSRGGVANAPVAGRASGPVTSRASAPLAGSAAQTPEQIAQEMRRVLGLEASPGPGAAPQAAPVQPPPPPAKRRPAPVGGATRDRRLEIHVDPHVGERIRDRHMRETRVGKPRAGRGAIGNLGGRVTAKERAMRGGSRFSLDDLRKAMVLNEILSPPVSVRPHDDRRPV